MLHRPLFFSLMMASNKKEDHSASGNDAWADQAGLYSNQAARITELHGSDLVAILKDDIVQAKTILDIGCGTGAFAQAYIRQFPRGVPGQTFILTDLSEGMLDKAREAIQPGSDFATKIVIQQEDGTKLASIDDNSIDLVVSLFGVFLIPDVDATLASIQRVLKKEGVFGNASWMFDVSEYFSQMGFGVSLQDAFRLPNKVIDPNSDKNSPIYKWSNPTDVAAMFDGRCDKVNCHSAVHTAVWEWDYLWQVMAQNPMSAIKNAAPDDVERAETALKDFVTNHGNMKIEEPILLSTASVLAVVRGFGKHTS